MTEIILTTRTELKQLLKEVLSGVAPGDLPVPDYYTYDQIGRFHNVGYQSVWNWTKKGKRSSLDGNTYFLKGDSNRVAVDDYLEFKRKVFL